MYLWGVGLLLNFGPLPDLTQFFIYFSTSRCQHTCEWQVQHGYLSRIQALDDGEEAKARHAGRDCGKGRSREGFQWAVSSDIV